MKTYSLREAAEATGYSEGRFRYNKTKLVELGTVIEARSWTIPESALTALGWLDPTKPKTRKLSKLEMALTEVKALKAENAALRAELAALVEASSAPAKRGFFSRKK